MKITIIKTVILNGTRTEITDQLNKKGYDFKRNGENIVFSK